MMMLCNDLRADGWYIGGGCCDRTTYAVLLTDVGASLALDDFGCRGDDSRVCCSAPAYGQTVIATG
jgi:hypothetical protein